MKKIIADLKVNDFCYFVKGNEVSKLPITSISTKKIIVRDDYVKDLDSNDFTRWNFDAKYYSTIIFYLEKLDALKVLRINLGDNLNSIFHKMENFNKSIMDANSFISDCDKLIAQELLK